MKTNLKVNLIAATDYVNKQEFPKFETLNEQYDFDGGLSAGICYMPSDFETLKNKPVEITEKRALRTKEGGHHSVFEHDSVSLIIENIPKLFAMMLNNEKAYVTSEKSARYTKFDISGLEYELYTKWCTIFEKKITEKYGNERYFDAKRIAKLAQENARYLISVYTPTTMRYTVSYRQLNYIYHWLKNGRLKAESLFLPMFPYFEDFCEQLENLKLIDEKLADDQKNRGFYLISNRIRESYFGDVYCTSYLGSFAQLAQAQRHRTISYDMHMFGEGNYFYLPNIISGDTTIVDEWFADCQKLKKDIPQGTMVLINERGTYENLILKAKERLCTAAQLEINDQTKETIKNFISNCKDPELVDEMEKYNKGARCTFPDYKCKEHCGFAEGVNLNRIV